MHFNFKLLFHVLFLFGIKTSIQTEEEIRNYLFNSTYDRTLKPSDLIEIVMELTLKQIVNLDERSQILTTASYLIVKWNDTRLKWNSDAFNNTKMISIYAKKLWLPDLFVTNTADSNGFVAITDSNIGYIQSDGSISLTLSLIGLRTRCLLKFRNVI